MNNKINITKEFKEILMSLTIGLVSLLIFAFLPSENFLEKLTKSLFFLFLIPIFYIKIILKKNLNQFGLLFREKRRLGITLGFASLIFSLAVMYLIISYANFSQFYVLPHNILDSFGSFLIYELVFFNIIIFFQEYFFKGFLLSIVRERLGYFSILFQAIIYLIPLMIISSSLWVVIPLIITSLLGGFIAYKTKTFFYSYLYALLFFILIDSYLIYLNKSII